MATVERTPSQQRIPRSRSARLANQAATAALYVTHPERSLSVRQPSAEPDPATLSQAGFRPGLSNASAAAALMAHARKQEPEPGLRRGASVSHTADRRRAASPIHEGYPYQAAMSAIKYQKAPPPTTFASRKRAESAPSEAARQGATARLSMVEKADEPFEDLDKWMQASRIQNAHLNPKLFTATPPVAPEVEEHRRKSILEAASMSMTKDMYGAIEAKDTGLPTRTRSRRSVSISKPESPTLQRASTLVLSQALNLHDVAQKRAEERLAGLEDEQANYRNYYGLEPQDKRSSLTIRRRRGSNETEQFDAERSKEIRTQMSALRSKLNAVDEKRENDRASLLELARKNVDAAIRDMDKQILTEGQSVAMQKYLDEKAAERAQKDLKDLDAQYILANKVNIGGRKYIEMADVEDLARARLQPTLDEIDERAESLRARELEARLDEERRQRLTGLEREREADIKAEEERAKAEEQQQQELLKQEQQQELKSKEEKVWSWKRKSRQLHRTESGPDKTPTEPTMQGANGTAVEAPAAEPTNQVQAAETASQTDSVAKRESKFKNWFKEKIHRRPAVPAPKETDGTQEQMAEPSAEVITGTEAEETSTAEVRGGIVHPTTGPEPESSETVSRASPLRSHPVTADDLHHRAESGSTANTDKPEWQTPNEYITTERDLKEIIEKSESRKQQREKDDSVHKLPSESTERVKDEPESSADPLPAPPSLGDVVGRRRASSGTGTVRESRFSENL
ncbi:uncharacterized protein BDV17DRAFT_258112 [Aspergillus undulatus]|uniref:uncharacterized protein n=1 Tax=Aspergillus undulatus TaxID=1810928 RepID=UPI003CCD205F